jgi:hypothetical protein
MVHIDEENKMKIWLTIALCTIASCVHVAEYPKDWGKIEQLDFTGVYKNSGIVDPESKSLGHNAPRLQYLFWPESSFNADAVKMVQKGNGIEILAMKSNEQLAVANYVLTEEGFVVSRSKSEDGGTYKAVYRFYRTANGIVVESDVTSLGVFIIPIVGSDKIWRFYQAY